MNEKLLRQLPSVDSLMKTESAELLVERYGRKTVVEAARFVLSEFRSVLKKEIKEKKEESDVKRLTKEMTVSQEDILERIEGHLEKVFSPSLVKAVNASGVILHTGLGRAVLPKVAQEAIDDVIKGYCTLATNIETGRRSHRDVHLNDILCQLTGAEAATVVNNNAAATMLILNTLAKGKEVIVSRGQLVEIGGSFRMPDVMESSGAKLREVGTTNKTHLRDYESAVWEETGAIMRVHHSNYRIVGFAGEPSIEELAPLAKEHNLSLIDDLGSGALVDLKEYGLETEPMVQDSLKAGADIACFSGDKLIGGPQSGVIVGKAELIQRIRKNPLARAFRIGKMTIAAMEVTLRLFRNPEKLNEKHPVYRMFSLGLEEIERRTKNSLATLQAKIPDAAEFSIVDGGSQVGSGSVPVQTLPTKLLMLKPRTFSVEELAKELRHNHPPIFARVQNDAVLLDYRTIQEEEDTIVLGALLSLLKKG